MKNIKSMSEFISSHARFEPANLVLGYRKSKLPDGTKVWKVKSVGRVILGSETMVEDITNMFDLAGLNEVFQIVEDED